jgi:hydrogenase maturation protein HypF
VPERLRVALRGAVQGVGFRPFVYRIATARQLRGWCRNSSQGVVIEVEGERPALESFRVALDRERPPRASIHGSESSWLDAVGLGPFAILDSDTSGEASAVVMPDIALCESCRGELLDPTNRRYRYPFINCTNCGPRYSIVESLPYDRANTSMRRFAMCPDCQREYRDPGDRRFHAEPNACPTCGPQVALWDAGGHVIAERDAAMVAVANAVRAGLVVALKGLGGFQLIVDATDDAAVRRLRARKHRDEKPFALMCPDLDCVQSHTVLGDVEARLLTSPEAPIVLVRARDDAQRVAPSVAPGMHQLGVMLPYTPLHVLLMRDLRRPLVVTSGNLAEEPMCIDERHVVDVLGGIADVFLVHDRPIVRAVDDSVVRVVAGRELVLRRARGYAPLPVPLPAVAPPLVAVGGHLKNTVSVTAGAGIVVSQHIGDLDSASSGEAFHTTLASLEHLHGVRPAAAVIDLHPDYQSTAYGRTMGLPVTPVQHHYAHLAACMVDNDVRGSVVGAVWDGTGYGTDGTIWGGEFLRATAEGFERVACLRPFRLPGGDAAAREPRRSALAVLTALGEGALARWQARRRAEGLMDRDGSVTRASGDVAGGPAGVGRPEVFTAEEWRVLPQAIARGLNAPVTTSMGRLLDAVARFGPDVVIVDVRMPYMDGLECLRRLRVRCPVLRVLLITAYDDPETLHAVVEAGPDGLLLKSDPPDQVASAIRQVMAGQLVFPAAARRALGTASTAGPAVELSARERDVLELVAQGLSNGEITARLHISANTVKFHLQNIYQRLGVTNRTEASRWYLMQGERR